MTYILKHLIGSLLFWTIIFFTVLIENVEKFPSLASKLPIRNVVVAKQEVKLYQCENFSRRNQIGVLKVGEIADSLKVECGNDTRWTVQLSDGKSACYSSVDEKKVERKTFKFYYF